MTRIVLPPDTATARTLGIPIREAELHAAVEAVAGDLLPKSAAEADLVIAQELELAYGRPDIIAASLDLAQFRRWRDKRIAPCTAPLALGAALALSDLGGRATLDELVACDGATARPRLRRSISTLADLGWIRRRGDRFELRLVPGEGLCAASGVEAKLNNWRRAVRQVQSWEPYVDAVWLAFPAAYIKHVPRTTPLRRFGLIAVDSDKASIIRRPRGTRARGVRHMVMEQHVYARWLRTTRRRPQGSPLRHRD